MLVPYSRSRVPSVDLSRCAQPAMRFLEPIAGFQTDRSARNRSPRIAMMQASLLACFSAISRLRPRDED
jgi:hypothetical protein